MGRVAGTVYDCMPTVCLVASVGILTALAWQVSEAFDSAHRVHEIKESVVAQIVAEDAAFDSVAQLRDREKASTFTIEGAAGLRSRVEPVFEEGRGRLIIEVLGKNDRSYDYECDLLYGSAPACLGTPLSVRHSVVARRPALRAWLRNNLGIRLNPIDETTVHSLLDEAVVGGLSADSIGAFEEDRSIGLLRIRAGTDRPDYLMARPDQQSIEPHVPQSGVRCVKGNLWLDSADHPLVVDLKVPLTILVTGNIYLGRSLTVRGPGRLLLVAQRGGAATFLDSDGDGAFTAETEGALHEVPPPGDDPPPYKGSVEGAGAIYLGLPNRGTAILPELEVGATLLARGEIYVRSAATVVRGALVAGQGISWAEGADLELPGDALPNIERERIPGFRRVGVTRPGMLFRVE